jgi:hypothetical protein
MATRSKFARMANYSCECGEASHIFLKNGVWQMSACLAIGVILKELYYRGKWFGECWRVWRVRATRLGECWRVWRVRATRNGECRRVWRVRATRLGASRHDKIGRF